MSPASRPAPDDLCWHPDCSEPAGFLVTTVVAANVPLCVKHSAEAITDHPEDWWLELAASLQERNGSHGA
jgi:hypothetical protein